MIQIQLAALSFLIGFAGYSICLVQWAITRNRRFFIGMVLGLIGIMCGFAVLISLALGPKAHETSLGNPWRDHISTESQSSSWYNPFVFW